MSVLATGLPALNLEAHYQTFFTGVIVIGAGAPGHVPQREGGGSADRDAGGRLPGVDAGEDRGPEAGAVPHSARQGAAEQAAAIAGSGSRGPRAR